MGFIKIDRKILGWGWYDDPITKAVFFHLLLNANWEDGWYRGVEIKAGQVVFGRKKYAEALGISERNVRTAIEHLTKTGEISTSKTTNRFTVITIEKWGMYQGQEQQTDQQSDQQPTNNRPTTDHIQERKKKRKKEYKGNPTVWISEIVPSDLQEVFIGWADMRDRIKKPIATRETVARAWAKVQKISRNPDTQKAVVEQSIDLCWASFWELKDKTETKKYPEFEKVEEAPGVPMTAEQRKNQQKIIQELKKAF